MSRVGAYSRVALNRSITVLTNFNFQCKYIQHLMNKTEAEFEMIFALENEAYCECDKRAPWAFFMHRRGNSMCDTCKKFEAGKKNT